MVHLVVRFLHLLSTAVWFGAPLFMAGDLRRALERGGGDLSAVARPLRVSIGAGVASMATGLGTIFLQGGFRFVRPGIHAALGLAIVLLVLEAVVLTRMLRAIESLAQAGRKDEAQQKRGAFAGVSGVTHLLRLVILALMVFR